MKKATILFLLLGFATTTFCQQEAPKPTFTNVDLLKKSKTQKTFAWVLVGTSAISYGKAFADMLDEDIFTDEYQHSYGLSLGIGTASLAGSVILFVASSKNKRKAKAASVFIDMEKIQGLQGTPFTNQSYPAVRIKIKI